MFGYASRRIRHDCHVPDTSEDLNIESMDCLAWVRTDCLAVWVLEGGRGSRRLRLRLRLLCCLPKRLTAVTHRRAEFLRIVCFVALALLFAVMWWGGGRERNE